MAKRELCLTIAAVKQAVAHTLIAHATTHRREERNTKKYQYIIGLYVYMRSTLSRVTRSTKRRGY